jgi:hypothetical protein
MFIQMSVIPPMMNDLKQFRHHLFDQNFGLGILHDDVMHTTPRSSVVGPLRFGYYHPWHYQSAQRSNVCKNKDDKDCFKVRF